MAKKEETPKAPEPLTQAFTMGSRIARSSIAVIDTVVARGGFKGEELSTIGQLRDQCTQMVQMAEAHQAQVAGQPQAPEPPKK